MTHLTPDQFIDAIDARDATVELPRRASAHLAECEACQAERARLAEALGDLRAAAIPEPSPLFWDHFSRRVRAATSDEPLPVPARGWMAAGWRPFAMVAVAVCALVLVVVMRAGQPLGDAGRVAVPAAVVSTPAAPPVEVVGMDDGSLSVVAVVAADLKTDELQQVARPSADATGAAIEDLTPAQCAELMRLIKTQMSGAE